MNDGWLSFLGVFLLILALVVGKDWLIRVRKRKKLEELTVLAGAAINSGDFAPAIPLLDDAIGMAPHFSWAYSARATCYFELSRFDEAIRDLCAAVRLDPGEALNYYSRGSAYFHASQMDKANADFDEVIRREPSGWSGFHARGMANLLRGRNAEAVVDLSTVLDARPELPEIRLNRAIAFHRCGRHDEAMHDAAQVMKDLPENFDALNLIAWIQATSPDDKLRNGESAIANARRACELSVHAKWYCLGTLAAAYAESGGFEEAIRWGEEMLRLAPENEHLDCMQRLQFYREMQPWREPPLPENRIERR